MENIQIGLQLMVVGLCLVFLVLVLLMYMMKIISFLVDKTTPPSPLPVAGVDTSASEQELAAVLAVAATLLDDAPTHNARLKVN